MSLLKDLDIREMTLKQAFIPQTTWHQCIVLEDGIIFTSEENYRSWLDNKDKMIPTQLTLDEKVDKLNQAGLLMALRLLNKDMEGKINV